MQIKVSIIVPVYNVEKYLVRCINSLTNQSLKEIEIIIVDDGSTDGSSQLCDSFIAQDTRIKVIHKQNEGLGFARNSGIEAANGEYIAYCDSDDYVKLDAYEHLYNAAKRFDADVVYGSFYKETSPGIWKEQRRNVKEEILEGDAIKDYLLDMIACAPHVRTERKHDMSSCMSVYRHQIIENHKIRFTSERVNASEDTIYNIDFLKKTNRIGIIPYSFYYYCLNEASLTQTFFPEKLDRFIFLRNQMIEHLGEWDERHERSNRFYIGYARSFLICSFKSSQTQYNPRKMIKFMISNSIWNELRQEYKPAFLPSYARLIYWLTIHKCLNLLVISGWCLAKLYGIKAHLA